MRTLRRYSFLQPASSNVVWLVFFCVAITIASSAQSLTTLARFNQTNGFEPASLILGTDGNFYGTTDLGGNLSACGGAGCGTIFKMTPAGVVTTLYSFNGVDGIGPEALVQGSDGNFYGGTFCSLPQGLERPSQPARRVRNSKSLRNDSVLCNGPGSVFRISPGGMLVFLHTFSQAEGWGGTGALVQGSDGNFYGAAAGGENNKGTIFRITPSGALTLLYTFGGVDGMGPMGGLVQGTDGNFYGTTVGGGANNKGTVFRITPSGALTTLHSFATTDGAEPNGNLVLASDGNFYGMTYLGGNRCDPEGTCGTVFKIAPDGTLTTVYYFTGPEGKNPYLGVVQGSDGNFYGTTYWGGNRGVGTVFRLTPAGRLSLLHSFCADDNCIDGESPWAGVVQGPRGLVYGTTSLGGLSSCNTGAGCGTVFAAGTSSTAYQFVPVTPCRLLDTRGGGGLPGGLVVTLQIRDFAQDFGCADLSSATAYSLNITVVPHGPLGYLSIWSVDDNQPLVSTLNSLDGRVKANAAIVGAGTNGLIDVYLTDTSDLILDIDGYFTTPGAQTLQFYPLPPCRVIDTRTGDGDLNGPYLHAGQQRDFPVRERICLTGAGNAQAYSFNVTAVPHRPNQPLGYLTMWAAGQPQPNVSTLNNPTGTAVANAAIVASGTGGGISTYVSDDTDLIVDVNGYFAPPAPNGNSYYTVPQCRAYDTRDDNGEPFTGERTVNIAGSPCAPPSNAAGYLFNATVVPSPTLGYLTLWADGQMQPVVSTLNAYDGFVTSNMAIVPNENGSIDAYADGMTQLILDISGYFAP